MAITSLSCPEAALGTADDKIKLAESRGDPRELEGRSDTPGRVTALPNTWGHQSLGQKLGVKNIWPDQV